VIEPGTPGDIPAAARLMAGAPLLQTYATTEASAAAALRAALADGDLLLVARRDTQTLAGLAWVSFAPRVLAGAAYLRLLLVADPGNGLGTTLLAAAEAHARARAEINHLYLLATTTNTGAHRFYARNGYGYIGTLPGLVQPGIDEALYHKTLRSPAGTKHD
jgi:GNAT superfamily N-acetyltransferase